MEQHRSTHAVAFTCSTIKYASIFQHWHNMVAHYGFKTSWNVAMDRAACAQLATDNLPHLCMQPSPGMESKYSNTTLHILSNIRYQVTVGKILPALVLLERNATVLFSEMDVFWYQDPLADLNGPEALHYDFQVMV